MHSAEVNGFAALLTDLIRTPDYSWKEAKKVISYTQTKTDDENIKTINYNT